MKIGQGLIGTVLIVLGPLFFAACGNAPAPGGVVPPEGASALQETLHLRIRAATPARVLYASRGEGEIYYGYHLPGPDPFCQSQLVKYTTTIRISTDKAGNVWVPTAVTGGTGYFAAFAPNCGAQVEKLSAPENADPLDIVFGHHGAAYGLMVYFVETRHGSRSNNSVSLYLAGATIPSGQLTDPALNNTREPADGVGIDSHGDVYVICCLQIKASRFAIKFNGRSGSQSRGKKIVLQDLTSPESLTFDSADNMIVSDLADASLNVYAPPYTGAPTIYPLQGASLQCALSSDETLLACADPGAGTIDLYSYPSLTYQYSLYASGYPSITLAGVAFAPGK